MDRPSGKASSSLEPPGDNRRDGRRLSPSPSSQTLTSTVSADGRESGLESLAPIASSQSRLSTAQSDVNVSSRPPTGQRLGNRTPSIRLRRNSNSSVLSQTNSIASESAIPEDASSAAPALSRFGRARSISNPNTGSTLGDGDARHSKRMPQIAMPRLTEEGSRPTMEELDARDGRLSPTASLPEVPNDRDSSMEMEEGPSQRRKRGMSLRFWPRRGSKDVDGDDSSKQSRSANEYDEHLVDYLDTVGKWLS